MIKTAIRKGIEEELHWMEHHFDVEILMAVEYGSRLWNLAGPASDHDIRFIYKDKPERAFSLFDRREAFSHSSQLPAQTGMIDVEFSGWSLEKALRLGVASNPQINEISGSPVLYRDNAEFNCDLKHLSADAAPRTMAHYYRGTAKKNLLGKICGSRVADVKTNLQMIRGFMSSLWFVQNPKPGGFPPLDFEDLRASVDLSSCRLPVKSLNEEIDALVQLKTETASRTSRECFVLVEQWGLGEMDRLEKMVKEIPDHRTDPDAAEMAFRRQYPSTFPATTSETLPAPG